MLAMGVLPFCRLAGLLLAGATAVSPRPAMGQEILLADRGPRFLLAASSRGGKPVEIQAGSNAMLRRVVSLKVEQPTVGRLLDAIERQTGLQFYYGRDVLSPDRPVSLRADSITVAAALMGILVDAGVDVLVSRAGPQVALVKRPPLQLADTGAILGRVTAKAGNTPLVGATVVVEGTRHSATTGNDGRYRIPDVATGTYTVRARYIGYAPGSVSVTVVAAQEASADLALEKSVQKLDEVVTTGTIVPTAEKALPSPITVIGAQEIEEKNITRIDQLFRGEIPGVFSVDEGRGDDITRIFVRGGSDLLGLGEIKTYVDGVQITTSNVLSTIDPNSIERVEVIRGPQASTIYGSEALNGVLQIFTKRGKATTRPTVSGRVSGGGIQTKWVNDAAVPTYQGTLTLAGGAGPLNYSFGAGRLYKGEWVSEYRDAENSLFGTIEMSQGWLSAELSGRVLYQSRGSPVIPVVSQQFADVPAVSVPFHFDLNYQSTGLGITLRAQATPYWQHAVTVGTDRLLQEFVQRRPRLVTPDDTLLDVESFDGHQLTFLYTTTLESKLTALLSGNLTAGFNATSNKRTGLAVNAPRSNGNLGLENVSFLGRFVTNNRGYFAQGQLALADQLFLTAGIRAESNDDYGQDFGLAWSPRVGLSYVRPLGTVTLKARASYGRSIRAPFSEAREGSADAFQIILPNPSLGPEFQRGWDAGIELYAGNWGSVQATYYRQMALDLIDQVLVTPGIIPTYQNQNVGAIRNRGLELEGTLTPWSWLTLSANLGLTSSKVERLSPTYTGDLQVGDQLLKISKRSGGARVRVSAAGWTASVSAAYRGPWTGIENLPLFDCFVRGNCRPTGRDYWTTYSGFTKYRLGINRRITPFLSAFIDADNLANSYAVEEDDFSSPHGRVTTAGLDFRF
jgi:outer membrane receptor protein involved in Fe transport